MPRIQEIEIYKFKELSSDVQSKVLDNNRYNIVENFNWFDTVIDEWQDTLSCVGFEGAEIQFSKMYSQGEGASFTIKLPVETSLFTLQGEA